MIEIIRHRRALWLSLSMAAILSSPVFVRAQADSGAMPASPATSDIPADLPKFDVATIKPTSDTAGRRTFLFAPGGISLVGMPVQMLLTEAFHVEDDHIIGAPGWVKTNRYDVEAKVSPDDAPRLDKLKFDDRRSMILPLLVERFNLKYHHETREMASYTLVVAKGGPKLKLSEVQPPPPDAKPPDPGANSKPGDSAPS